MVTVAPQLDFASKLFDPRYALSNRVCLPYPNAKTYNNLSEYFAYTFGKKGSQENELSSSKKDESNQVPERKYAWYYSTLGLEYSEDEEMEEYFSRDVHSKSSVAMPNKRKPTKSFPKSSKRGKCDAFAPLRSSKVIVSKATNSGQCKKYLCYSVKNVRKRLALRQTVDTYFEKQAKATPSDSTLNLPNSKKNGPEIVSGLSDRKGKCDRLNDYDSDSSDDSLSYVVKNGSCHNASDLLKHQNQKELHIKSVVLPKGDAVIPVKTIGRRTANVMNNNSSEVKFNNPPSLLNSNGNLSATNGAIRQNHQIGQFGIKNVNFAKNCAEDPAKTLKPKENNIDCSIKSTLEKKLPAMTKSGTDNISHNLSVSKSQKSLPPANKVNVLQKQSPKQLLNKVISAPIVKPTGFSKSSENVSDCLLKPRAKENTATACPTAISVSMDMKSKSKVISNGKLVQRDQRSAKKELNLPNSKPNKDFGMLKSNVKTRVNQENHSITVKENKKTSSSDVGTLLKYGAIIPNNNKLRGFKIPLKRKVLSEISN